MPRIPADLDKITDRPHRPAPCLAIGGLADEVDLIRQRAAILKPADRALVMLYLDCGRRFAELAAIAGVSETTIARRTGRIIRRLLDGQYLPCLRHRDRLGPLGQAVARDHLIDGMPIHAIAVRRRITVYRVRKILNTIRRLHDQTARRTPRGTNEGRN